MSIKHTIFILLAAVAVSSTMSSCKKAEGDYPGVEYMPDMGHPLTYEANVYSAYKYNTWEPKAVSDSTWNGIAGVSEFTVKTLSTPRNPVNGTIARGYTGVANASSEASSEAIIKKLNGQDNRRSMPVTFGGSVPYYYADTDEDRIKASKEILNAPFPITTEGLERGENLYNINCGICHGEKGDGNGYLVRDDGGKYPNQPASFVEDKFIDTTNGVYYHSIMHGKNVMGGYSDKLSYEERWQVIHYIRALQAKTRKLEYNGQENTLNSWAVPGDLNSESLAQFSAFIDGDHGHDHDSHDEAHVETLTLNILFETGSSNLKTDSRLELNTLAKALKNAGDLKFQLSGHTDNTGDAAANKSLSQSRADAVKNYLARRGVSADQLIAKGYGDSMPKASNETEEGRTKNRRTELSIIE